MAGDKSTIVNNYFSPFQIHYLTLPQTLGVFRKHFGTEIIPLEPDPDNTSAGKSIRTSLNLLSKVFKQIEKMSPLCGGLPSVSEGGTGDEKTPPFSLYVYQS